jgi:D-lyxose ketol-isomerase
MATPVQGLAVITSPTPGQPVDAIAANQSGGYVVNPLDAIDQGVDPPEPLYVSQVGPATTTANGTTLALQPGQSFVIVPGATTPVSVASKAPSHKFTAVQWV